MNPEFVNGIINRSNRNLITWCLLGIAVLVIGGVLFSNYLYNFISGPFTVTGDQILQATSLSDLKQHFITITGDDDLLDTGYQYVSTSSSGSETVESYYQALILANKQGDAKLLLVKTSKMLEGDTVTGGLVDMPSDVRSEVIQDIESEYPKMKDTFLPLMLDTGDYRFPGYIGLFIAALILILAALGLTRWLARRGDPLKHPIMKGLSRFGDPEAIANEIDMEMAGDTVKVGKLTVSRKWLLQTTPASLKATRLKDVVWTYKQVTQHRTNGIPTGKTYSALIWDRYGMCIVMQGKEKQVEESIGQILQRAPGAVAGYSPDIQKMWKSNRQGFIAAVDQRRQETGAKAS